MKIEHRENVHVRNLIRPASALENPLIQRGVYRALQTAKELLPAAEDDSRHLDGFPTLGLAYVIVASELLGVEHAPLVLPADCLVNARRVIRTLLRNEIESVRRIPPSQRQINPAAFEEYAAHANRLEIFLAELERKS